MSKIRLSSFLVALAAAASPAFGGAADDDLRPVVGAALEVYNELAEQPLPFLTSDQTEALLRGDVVRFRRRPPDEDDAPERVTGFILIRRPLREVWLSALDPAFQASDWLTEVRLEQSDDGRSLWYQHLDLPWPITDRHWVIELWKTVDLARATNGAIWEQRWDLAEDGPAIAQRTVAAGLAPPLTPESIADAIYLPVNRGAWTLFALDDDVTMIAYRVTTVVGGKIPDSWITTVAMAQLEGLLHGVERHIPEALAHYDPSVSPIYDGFGALIDGVADR